MARTIACYARRATTSAAWTAAVLAGALAACHSGDSVGTIPVSSIPVATVSIAPAAPNPFYVGRQFQFTGTVKDAGTNTLTGRTVAWTTSNAGIAAVDNTGRVTATGVGTAIITAASEGKSATASVTVALAPVATVVVSPSTQSVSVGSTVSYAVMLKDADSNILTGRAVAWTTSDITIATVNTSGVVTGVAAGGATITATSEGRTGTGLASVVAPPSGSVLRAGPTRSYKTPCAAIAAARAGDTIEIDAVTYTGDVCVIATAGLTLRGVGGRPKLDAGGKSAEGKAIWVIRNPSTTVENIEFANAVVPDNNGAGIRHESGNLVVRGCYFNRNQDGILTGADSTSDIVIEGSEFAFSGQTPTPGYEHNIYVGAVRSFTLRWSYSHHVFEGNLVKSRARTNYILYNRITGESGTDSYELDLPNGGRSFVIGNIIEQGPSSPNHAIIEYGAEGIPAGRSTELFVVNNTIVNDATTGTFVWVSAAVPTPVTLRNNIFAGPGTITTQATAVLEANTTAADGNPMFRNPAAYDYRLLSGSPAIDRGVDPSAAFGVSLAPVLQYAHPTSATARTLQGPAIDRGAYEFAPVGATQSRHSATSP
ncbi:MAG: Ig-like domain-containing protein [Gemmatimonadaceae bacterium]